MTFIMGDCLEVMKTLTPRSVDCFICDLPYGQLSQQKGATPFGRNVKGPSNSGCPWDVKINLVEFWGQVRRLSKDDHTPVIMFCNTKFGFELYNSNPDWFRYDLVWNKDRGVSFLLANKMPMKSHEMIYVFSKKGAYYNRIDIKGDYAKWNASSYDTTTRTVVPASGKRVAIANDGTTRSALSVINMRKPNTLGHPTEKPLELYKWILERYCRPGGTVLDPTAGSFNSIFAAKELGLKGIGIEKDNGFFWKGISKLEKIERSISVKTNTPPIPQNTIELK